MCEGAILLCQQERKLQPKKKKPAAGGSTYFDPQQTFHLEVKEGFLLSHNGLKAASQLLSSDGMLKVWT